MIQAKHVRLRFCATTEPSAAILDIDDVYNLTLHEVENYGTNGKVTVYNKHMGVATQNIISKYCTLWNDGQARAVAPGIFIRLYENERTSSNALGVFFISKIQAVEETVNIEFGDCIQLLKATGADYVRNHYDAGGMKWHNSTAIWETDQNRGYVEKPASITLPSTGQVRIYQNASKNVTEYDELPIFGSEYADCEIPTSIFIEQGAKYLRQIKNIKVRNSNIYEIGFNFKIGTSQGSGNITSGGIRVAAFSDGSYSTGTFSGTVDLTKFDKIWIRISHDNLISGQYMKRGVLTDARVYNHGNTYYSSAPVMTIVVQRLRTNVVGDTDSSDAKKWIVQTIDGQTPVKDDFQNWDGQAQVEYVDEESKITAADIIKLILDDAGMTLNQDRIPVTREVNIFRCYGDYYFNYILALCDMPNQNGQQFVITADRDRWGVLYLSYRYRVDNPKTADSPRYQLFYSQEAPETLTDTQVVFESFNPSISLQNKPRLSVVKGTTNAERPIMVAVLDPEIPIGASLPSVSGSVTTAVEAGLAAYKNVITNRSKNWDGTIVIAGIDRRFFLNATEYGAGGVPIEIIDVRYGMRTELARVKEVEYDFHNQTTTLTINNYSEIYSNGLVDTEKMAYTAGDLSSEATSDDMFVRQFVSLDLSKIAALPPTIESMTLYGKNGFSERLEVAGENDENFVVIKMPELKIAVLNVYFAQPVSECPDQYGITQVQVNGGTVWDIPESRCPDRYSSQSLIVNIIYHYEESEPE